MKPVILFAFFSLAAVLQDPTAVDVCQITLTQSSLDLLTRVSEAVATQATAVVDTSVRSFANLMGGPNKSKCVTALLGAL